MNAKEKAKQLVDKMNYSHPEFEMYVAKQCALIAVEEILSMGIMADSKDWNMAKEYWQEVKQEINNL